MKYGRPLPNPLPRAPFRPSFRAPSRPLFRSLFRFLFHPLFKTARQRRVVTGTAVLVGCAMAAGLSHSVPNPDAVYGFAFKSPEKTSALAVVQTATAAVMSFVFLVACAVVWRAARVSAVDLARKRAKAQRAEAVNACLARSLHALYARTHAERAVERARLIAACHASGMTARPQAADPVTGPQAQAF
jgi:hypothetical protein